MSFHGSNAEYTYLWSYIIIEYKSALILKDTL